MFRLLLFGAIFFSLFGCKVSQIPSKENTGFNFKAGTTVESGPSIGREYFDARDGSIASENIEGLWRSNEYADGDMIKQEAWYIFAGNDLVMSVMCKQNGMTAYATVKVPATFPPGKINIASSKAYISTVSNSYNGLVLKCTAYIEKSQINYKIKNATMLLRDSEGDALYFKIRDSL